MLLLVVGTGRCGSTLVTEVIARHPDVGFVSGLDDKLAWLKLLGRVNGHLYRRCAPRPAQARALSETPGVPGPRRMRVAPSEGWRLFDRVVTSALSRPCRDLLATDQSPELHRRLHRFVDQRIRAQHAPVFLQHLTGWPRTGLLSEVFPELRVIHVVRDGRAVANSWLQMGWWDGWVGPDSWYLGPLQAPYAQVWEESGRSFAALAGIGWTMLEDAFDAARARVPADQWLDVRYEDMLASPREQVARMLDFGSLPWSRRFEAGLRRHHLEPVRSTAYRKQLTAEQLRVIERVTLPQLRRWGYADVADGSSATPVGVAGPRRELELERR